MKYLKQSFRWYGPSDPVSLGEIKQAGATDIVTALHHIPNGEIWTEEEIQKRIDEVEAHGLIWSVVESLPITEEMKTRSGDYQTHIANYKTSLSNLGKLGIKIVTYNFMPILDWTRTDLDYELPEGYTTLRFDRNEIVLFDVFILKRKDAEKDYSPKILEKASSTFQSMNTEAIQLLVNNIIKGLPGAEEGYTVQQFRDKLKTYSGIDHAKLKENIYTFLKEIVPVAEQFDIKMAIHPDDPPFDIFGLPRIMSTKKDMDDLVKNVPSSSNGFCFCTGSFGVRPDNDLIEMAKAHSSRVYFLHFRSTQRDEEGNFFEANHLEGDANIPEVMKVFVVENQKRKESIPYRPDHGYRMLDDLSKAARPGYSCLGRMKGLAELRGLEKGLISGGLFS